MAEKKVVEEQVETPATEPAKTKTVVKKVVVKEPEKKGLWTRMKEGVKNHKREIIAAGVGVAAGVGGTVGVCQYGKKRAEKAARNTIPQQEYSPLDPNI